MSTERDRGGLVVGGPIYSEAARDFVEHFIPTAREASAHYGPPLDVPRFTFRAVEWDGPAPARGDILCAVDGAYVVTSVVHGAGIGHYRIETTRARLIAWDGDAPTPG